MAKYYFNISNEILIFNKKSKLNKTNIIKKYTIVIVIIFGKYKKLTRAFPMSSIFKNEKLFK